MTLPMNKNDFANIRIANFCDTKLVLNNVLTPDTDNIQAALQDIRKYGDLPYGYLRR